MLQAIAAKASVQASVWVLAAACAWPAAARGPVPVEVDSSQISVQELPPQGRTTYQLILQGGPFPFEKDGTVFGNRERQLPRSQRGYYREYTVKTPRSRDRGARRIVCGGMQPQQPEACYYTSDHYSSFRKITP